MDGSVLRGGAWSPKQLGDRDSSGRCDSGWDTARAFSAAERSVLSPTGGGEPLGTWPVISILRPPTQTSTQIAPGPRHFQCADKACLLLFLLFIIFKGTKFGVKAGSSGKLSLVLEVTMAKWRGERVIPELSVDSHSVQEPGAPSVPGAGFWPKTGLFPAPWFRHVLRPSSTQVSILG